MNFTPSEFETYALSPGDVLLNEGQSLELVGRPALYRGELPGACFQNTLVRFRSHNGVLPEYALAVFLAYLHTNRFQRIARWTTNIAHLGADRFAGLQFPLPPADEQKRIVAALDESLSRMSSNIKSAQDISSRAATLRAAILQAAFSGNLVQQTGNRKSVFIAPQALEDKPKKKPARSEEKPKRTAANV